MGLKSEMNWIEYNTCLGAKTSNWFDTGIAHGGTGVAARR